MDKTLLSEMTYDDYLAHYGVKGMKWGETNSAIKTAATEFQKAILQRQGELKKAVNTANSIKDAVVKDVQNEGRKLAEAHQKAWDNSPVKKELDKATAAQQKAWNNSQTKKELDKANAAHKKNVDAAKKELEKANAAHKKNVDAAKKELEKANAAHKKNVDAAKKELDKAISDPEKYRKEKAASRKEEYKKLKSGLTGSPEKAIAAGVGVVAAKYGGLAIPAYNMARSQGLSKGKAVVAAALGGPLSNVVIAEMNATSKARRKVSKR